MLIILLAATCVVAVALQDILPGQAWYHTGVYALAIIALCIVMAWRLNKYRPRDRAFNALVLICAAAVLVALAGVASGLLGPDTQTFSGAPGANVAVSEPAGTLRFPFYEDPRGGGQSVQFIGAHGEPIAIARRRYTSAYVIWSEPHPVALLSASDAAGHRLTITQPTNASFLSPVLLFTQTAKIGGRSLPVDSFSLPAVQRVVKAVFFPASTLALIQNRAVNRPAILVAVENERGKLLPGAIRLVPSGGRVTVAGVTIGAVIVDYPRVTIAAAPSLPILVLGIAGFVAGLVWYGGVKSPFRLRR